MTISPTSGKEIQSPFAMGGDCSAAGDACVIMQQTVPSMAFPPNQWLIGPALATFFLLAGYFSASGLGDQGAGNAGGPPPDGFAASLSFLVCGLLAGGGHASCPDTLASGVWAGNMSHAYPDVVSERFDDFYPGRVFALPFPSSPLRLWPVLPVSAPVG